MGTQTRGPCPSEDQRAQRPAPQQTREPCSSGSWRQRRLAGGAMSDVTEGGPGGRAGRAEAAAAHVGHVLLHAQACYSVESKHQNGLPGFKSSGVTAPKRLWCLLSLTGPRGQRPGGGGIDLQPSRESACPVSRPSAQKRARASWAVTATPTEAQKSKGRRACDRERRRVAGRGGEQRRKGGPYDGKGLPSESASKKGPRARCISQSCHVRGTPQSETISEPPLLLTLAPTYLPPKDSIYPSMHVSF